MFSALHASFFEDQERGRKLRELEAHFSAAHWFGDPRTGSELMQLTAPFVCIALHCIALCCIVLHYIALDVQIVEKESIISWAISQCHQVN